MQEIIIEVKKNSNKIVMQMDKEAATDDNRKVDLEYLIWVAEKVVIYRNGRKLELRIMWLLVSGASQLDFHARISDLSMIVVDIAEVSIQQARRRWEELRGRRFNANFYALDCYSVSTQLPVLAVIK